MKRYLFLVALTFILSCKSSNNSLASTETKPEIEINQVLCPTDGNCKIQLHYNSSLILKKDTIDKLYPVIEDGNHIVVEYAFSRKGPEGTADGDYSETIYFEIDEKVDVLNLEGDKLADVNLIFGKECFCRDEAGYYKVNEGNLSFQKSKDEISIDLSFELNEISHRISRIKKTVKL
ncbi:hypothetical protein [Aquimarina sp. MMG016]|uniref:hypothetical protein n=1 Tax=Aquimarina sp. MMG016 TaxID=2822690 RepID=UPI001B3A2294|nr:hypothetical protein [Aquimarina sp. MMG016]MBQ4822917.1 hypothetical protein [Aquimarina sp. MMG016]